MSPLGSGAMGTVYEARDELFGDAPVALKCLWPSKEAKRSARLLETLRDEFRILATVRHPLLCRVFDFGGLPAHSSLPAAPSDGRAGYFLCRELITGADLNSIRGRPIGDVCRLFARAAAGLDVLHRAGLRHGDFKPANAISTGDDVRLIDFGLTALEGSRERGGTLAYAAPELLSGKAADRRADLYALGISLYEILAGELPSGSVEGSALSHWHRHGSRPILAERIGAPTFVSDLCSRLLESDPNLRYPSAAEVEAALLRAAEAIEPSRRKATSAPPLAASPLVYEPLDRDIAERALDALLARCGRRGGASVIEIVGAPGSGRTTVLTELSWRAQLAGIEVVQGDATRRDQPLAAIAPALSQLSTLVGGELPHQGPELAHALAAANKAVAILLDDVDFADPGARALLAATAGALPPSAPVAFVVTRDEQASPLGSIHSDVFVCSPLSFEEIGVLVERALNRTDDKLSARVSEHTGGNLLHVVATLETLSQGSPGLGPLAELPLPSRLAASSLGQLESMHGAVLDAARAIAVIGRATLEDASQVLALNTAEVVSALESASPAIGRGRDGLWQLLRPQLAQAINDEMPIEVRQNIHRRAATLPDRGPASRLRHCIGGGLSAEVRELHQDVLNELRDRGDTVGALELGIATLRFLSQESEAPDQLRVELGELAQMTGECKRACELLEQALESSELSPPLRGRAALALGRALDAGGDPERAESMFEAAARADNEVASEATRDHVFSLIRRGKNAEALELAVAAQGDDPHLIVAAIYARGSLGENADAARELEAMALEARKAGDRALESAALHLGGLAAYSSGDWRTTRAFQERALSCAEEIGDAIRAGTLRMNLAAMDQSEGEWASALARGSQAVSLLSRAGARTYALMARRNHAQMLLEIGATEQARRELASARGEARELNLPIHGIGIGALLGILEARAGHIEVGREALTDAEQAFLELGDRRRAGETTLDLIELELDLASDPVRAMAALERVRDEPTITSHPGRNARLIASSALAHALAGTFEVALAELRALSGATELLRDQGGAPLRAEIHGRAARTAALSGEPELTRHHRHRAETLLEDIGSSLLPDHRLAFWQDTRRIGFRRSPPSKSVLSHAIPSAISVAPSLETERVFQLLAIYSQLSAQEDPDSLLTAAMEQAALLVGANRGFLLLAKADGLVMVANRNLPSSQLESIRSHETRPETVLPQDLPYSRSVAEEVFRTGEPVIGDIRADARFASAASVHSLTAPSVLCVPACAGGKVVGALYLESNTNALELGPADARLLSAFGDQVAVLLGEAELKRQLKDRADELEAARTKVEALLAERTQLLTRRTDELSIAVRENSKLSRRLRRDGGAFGLVGSSPAMEKLFELIERVSATDAPVLIVGESGTGKELVARAIHAQSQRANELLVAVNCAALPETLLESELFGHVRGSFTGATRDRSGLFETADGSTLFLDEISETPPRMQAAMLRAVQEGVVRPVGGRETSVDVRVVCASNRDLHELSSRGEFREDLLYRLAVLTIAVPPLRERQGDIPLLCEHFLKGIRERTSRPGLELSSEALRLLFDQPWPGNVRQLEHALTGAAVMAGSDILGKDDFAPLLEPSAPAIQAHVDAERAEILAALENHDWNRSQAARSLNMPRRTFYRRLAKYGIQ